MATNVFLWFKSTVLSLFLEDTLYQFGSQVVTSWLSKNPASK